MSDCDRPEFGLAGGLFPPDAFRLQEDPQAWGSFPAGQPQPSREKNHTSSEEEPGSNSENRSHACQNAGGANGVCG